MALHLNLDNFEQTISSGKVMVDFWAPWCMPCQSLLPVIDELSNELNGTAVVAKVNVDENKSLAQRFRVMSIPTVVFFVDGVEKERLVGVYPKEKYIQTINSL
jgi:thioredoxin 1